MRVASLGSLSKAAEQLHTVQPAVSRQIRLLEEELGVTLLVRHSRGVDLTEAGTIVLQRASRLLQLADELKTEVETLYSQPKGLLRLAFPPSVGVLFMAELVAEFRRSFPGVRLYLSETLSTSVRELLLADAVDFGIISNFVAHSDLTATPLFMEEVWVVSTPELWRFGHSPVDLGSLDGLPLLYGRFLEPILADAKRGRAIAIEPSVALDSGLTAKNIVQQGGGFLIAPASSVRAELGQRKLQGAQIEDLVLMRSLVRRVDHPPTKAMLEFTNLLMNCVDELLKTSDPTIQPARRTG